MEYMFVLFMIKIVFITTMRQRNLSIQITSFLWLSFLFVICLKFDGFSICNFDIIHYYRIVWTSSHYIRWCLLHLSKSRIIEQLKNEDVKKKIKILILSGVVIIIESYRKTSENSVAISFDFFTPKFVIRFSVQDRL